MTEAQKPQQVGRVQLSCDQVESLIMDALKSQDFAPRQGNGFPFDGELEYPFRSSCLPRKASRVKLALALARRSSSSSSLAEVEITKGRRDGGEILTRPFGRRGCR